MTNEEFAAALGRLMMSQRTFAIKAGVTPEAVNRWCKGGREVPDWAAWIVELLIEREAAWPDLVAYELALASRVRIPPDEEPAPGTLIEEEPPPVIPIRLKAGPLPPVRARRRAYQAPLDGERCEADRLPLGDGSGARCMHRRKAGSRYCAQHARQLGEVE